jgi:hypothetical protein
MSRIVRIGALLMFVGVLAWQPTPVKAFECTCTSAGQNFPFLYFYCADCLDAQDCAAEWQCTLYQCEPDEENAAVMMVC